MSSIEQMLFVAAAVAAAAFLLWYLWLRKIERRGWSIGPLVKGKNYSRNMPAVPAKLAGGVWSVTVKPGAELDGVTIARGAITGAMRATYRVSEHGLFPSEQMEAVPVLTLYFQREGDDWTGRDKFGFYRWYSIEGFPLTPGTHEIVVPLEPALWCSVNGPAGHENAATLAGFLSALTTGGRLGLGFGWMGGRMHGVETAVPVTIDLLDWGQVE